MSPELLRASSREGLKSGFLSFHSEETPEEEEMLVSGSGPLWENRKAAGGISTAKDAVVYYAIAKSILGTEWLNKDLFRFGVSRLANALMSAIEQKTVNYF